MGAKAPGAPPAGSAVHGMAYHVFFLFPRGVLFAGLDLGMRQIMAGRYEE